MGLFDKKEIRLDKYRTYVVYEATYSAAYKDGTKKRDKIQINCGLTGAILLKEVCRQIKHSDESMAKVSIRNLKIKQVVTDKKVVYGASDQW